MYGIVIVAVKEQFLVMGGKNVLKGQFYIISKTLIKEKQWKTLYIFCTFRPAAFLSGTLLLFLLQCMLWRHSITALK